MSKKNKKTEATTHIRIYKSDKKYLAKKSLEEDITIADIINLLLKKDL